MNLTYKKATIEDLDVLCRTRIEVLKVENRLADDVNAAEVEAKTSSL